MGGVVAYESASETADRIVNAMGMTVLAVAAVALIAIGTFMMSSSAQSLRAVHQVRAAVQSWQATYEPSFCAQSPALLTAGNATYPLSVANATIDDLPSYYHASPYKSCRLFHTGPLTSGPIDTVTPVPFAVTLQANVIDLGSITLARAATTPAGGPQACPAGIYTAYDGLCTTVRVADRICVKVDEASSWAGCANEHGDLVDYVTWPIVNNTINAGAVAFHDLVFMVASVHDPLMVAQAIAGSANVYGLTAPERRAAGPVLIVVGVLLAVPVLYRLYRIATWHRRQAAKRRFYSASPGAF
ncbi:Uncharacterized protein PBTT_00852 [Plasmodiophora brassicae]